MKLTSVADNLKLFYQKMPTPPPLGGIENRLLLHDTLAHNFLGHNDISYEGEMRGVIDEGILRNHLNLPSAEVGGATSIPTNPNEFLDFVNTKGRQTYANESKQSVNALPLIDRQTVSKWYQEANQRLNKVCSINPHFTEMFFNLSQKGKELDILKLLEVKVPLEWFAELYQK